jgi:hypothetical protein
MLWHIPEHITHGNLEHGHEGGEAHHENIEADYVHPSWPCHTKDQAKKLYGPKSNRERCRELQGAL